MKKFPRKPRRRTEKPERVKVRAPTLANVQAVAHMLKDRFLADVPIVVAAIDPCFSCTERVEVVDVRSREARILTRFGPMFQIERMGGAFCLAAMEIPPEDFERVAAIVNGFPQVAHNYEREHRFNMWFVLATETPAGIGEAVAAIETASGYPVYPFPKEKEYFVEMKLQA